MSEAESQSQLTPEEIELAELKASLTKRSEPAVEEKQPDAPDPNDTVDIPTNYFEDILKKEIESAGDWGGVISALESHGWKRQAETVANLKRMVEEKKEDLSSHADSKLGDFKYTIYNILRSEYISELKSLNIENEDMNRQLKDKLIWLVEKELGKQ